ncbi:MAG: type II-A CRISPR-associated protein Csn2, partial [Lachnospiraceae bacterium]|nr:type II-A CRISPR-associated protein Csn2 [Lachnospiraceae bacterium]
MRISILGYENEIEFEDGYVNVLNIQNKHLFTNIISTLNELCNNDKYETNEIALHDDNGICKFNQYAEIVLDFFNIEINSKKIIVKLYDEISKNIDDIDKSNVLKLTNELRQLLFLKAEELEFNFEMSNEVSIVELLKLYDLKIDKNMYIDFTEKLNFLVDVISTLNIAKILILPNLKLYLDENEVEEFYKYALYKDLNILVIENGIDNKLLKYEKVFSID